MVRYSTGQLAVFFFLAIVQKQVLYGDERDDV